MPASGKVVHGHKRRGFTSPEYKTWLGMKARCYRPKNKDYPNWGGKGIRVCEEWRTSFMSFFNDMGPKPTPQHTIDRRDPSKDYSPDNCRWATQQEQGAENRSGLASIVVGGIAFASKALACRHFGIGQTTLNERLKAGIPIENAFYAGRLKSRRTTESYWPKSRRN